MKSILLPFACSLALTIAAMPAEATELDGCWRLLRVEMHRPNGNVDRPAPDCLRLYSGNRYVSSCRGGEEISVFNILRSGPGLLTYQQVDRLAFGARVPVSQGTPVAQYVRRGSTLHISIKSSDVRIEQQLSQLPANDCSSLSAYVTTSGVAVKRPLTEDEQLYGPGAKREEGLAALLVGDGQQPIADPNIKVIGSSPVRGDAVQDMCVKAVQNFAAGGDYQWGQIYQIEFFPIVDAKQAGLSHVTSGRVHPVKLSARYKGGSKKLWQAYVFKDAFGAYVCRRD